MSVECVGTLLFHDGHTPPVKGAKDFDPAFMLKLVQTFDACGYDRILVPQSTYWPDSMPMATWVTTVTKTLSVMIAHRPGFVTPTMAARMFATLDQLSGGRAGIHVITGGNDLELQCDGDFLTKDQRYQRTREFVDVLRKMWAAESPVTHAGDHFRFNNSLGQLRPRQEPSIPVYFGGNSESALQTAGACADVYTFGLASLEDTAKIAEKVRSIAAAAGRDIRFQGTGRVIMADTEAEAWDRAREVAVKLECDAAERSARLGGGRSDERLSTKKSTVERAVAADQARTSDIIDERLWLGTRIASKGQIAPAFVGTPTQVADAYMRYYDLGFRSFFLRDFFPPIEDIEIVGAKLIPLLRERVADRVKRAA